MPAKHTQPEQEPQPAPAQARRNMDHFCLEVESNSMEAVRDQLEALGVVAEEQFDGQIVNRFGAQGTAKSVYIQDPDGNTVELRTYHSEG